MLFEYDEKEKNLKPISGLTIVDSLGENEKDLENYLKTAIGDLLFPEYLVFGNERAFQNEADIFAVNSNGDLIIFELKVNGQYDRGKIYQALSYAQHFSFWRYREMNTHYNKCFGDVSLIDAFEEHFGFKIDLNEFNKNQKIIVISHSSSNSINEISKYWNNKGIEIEEYYYRFYQIDNKKYFELSNELFFPQNSYNCWINTCVKYFPKAYLDMIKNQKASAYGDRRGIIGDWLNKSNIFLYHNGYGIIAAGKGTATIKDYYNEEIGENEKYIKLNNFITGLNMSNGKIVNSISPKSIKELLERDFYFPNTMVTLSEDESEKLYQECQEKFKKGL